MTLVAADTTRRLRPSFGRPGKAVPERIVFREISYRKIDVYTW
jgi:hypothetical protein